jgi:hypothetical protein
MPCQYRLPGWLRWVWPLNSSSGTVMDTAEVTEFHQYVSAASAETQGRSRGLHSFPFPLNLSLLCPFRLSLSLLCPPYHPN